MKRFLLLLTFVLLSGFAFAKEADSCFEIEDVYLYFETEENIYLDKNIDKIFNTAFETAKNSLINKKIKLINSGDRPRLYLGWDEEINPEVKYPHVNIRISQNENKEIDFSIDAYRSPEDFTQYSMNYYVGKLNTETKTNIVEKTIEAGAVALLDTPEPEQTELDLIDTFDLTSYFPSEVKEKGAVRVAVNDDNTIAVFNANEVYLYNSFWKRGSCLTEGIKDSYWYYPIFTDSETVKIVDPNKSQVLVFNKEGKKTGTEHITLPDGKLYFYGLGDDGVPVYIDLGKNYYNSKFVRAGSKNEPLKEYTFNQGFNGARCHGNNGDFWIERYDGICVYDRNGALKKIIFKSGKEERDSILSIVEKNNSFITYNFFANTAVKYNYDGKKLWSAKLPDACKQAIELKAKNGILYISTFGAVNRVAEKDARLPAALAKIQKLNKNLKDVNSRKTNAAYYKQLSEIYIANGGISAGYQYLKKYLELSPADPKAQEQLLNCELLLAKESIKIHSDKAIALYEEYGEETAGDEYKTAMKSLEKYRKYYPGDADLQKMYFDLKECFGGDSDGSVAIPSLSVESVELGVLFPALMNVYACEPSGILKVKNVSKNTVKNVELKTNIRKYMDFASASDVVAEIKAGETCIIPVKTVLNSESMNVDETKNVQMQLTLTWQENDRQKKQVITRPVTLYKKSAIVWKDTSMLSCFILPNDKSVTDFAFNAIGKSEKKVLSRNISNAILICNSVGTLPVKYIPDPASPVTEQLGNEFAVDTVRLPFETLKLKGGDCDDLTALLCSLLESAGINSALITTAGHIFIAFDSGLSYNSMWDNLSDGFAALEVDGEAWIPVEVTALSKGFVEAWKIACGTLMAEDFEFVTVGDSMMRYQSVSVESPDENYFSSKVSDAEKNIDSSCFDEIVKMFVKASSVSEKDCKDSVELNSIARCYFELNDVDSAIETLLRANKIDSKNKAVVSNLASLYKLKGDETNYSKYDKIAKSLSENMVNKKTGSQTTRGDNKSSVSMTSSGSTSASGVRIKNKAGVVKRTMPVSGTVGGKTVTQRSIQTASSRADEKNKFEWNE